MLSPNTTENVSSSLERTLEGSRILEIIRGNLTKAAARRNVPPNVRTPPTPSDLKLQLYELGILSRHLLFSDSPDEKWSTRWVAALDKVAQAFATEIPLAQPDSDDNCVNYDRNIDEWINTVVPEHMRIIRVVLKADNEHQKLLELVQSLQQIHQNLDAIARVFPGGQEVRRRQLKDLMLTLLSSLQEHQMDLEDTVPPGEVHQLFALANFAAQQSYDEFSESFSGHDSFDASVIGPAYNFLPTIPTTSHSSQPVADHGDEHVGTVDMSTTGIRARSNLACELYHSMIRARLYSFANALSIHCDVANQFSGRVDANDTIDMSMTGVMTRSDLATGRSGNRGSGRSTSDMSLTGVVTRHGPDTTRGRDDTTDMSLTGVMTSSNFSVDDASHAIEEVQPPAVPMERRASDATSTSSVTSVLQRTPESGSTPSSPRGNRRPIENIAVHRPGGTISTSTPVQGGRPHGNARRTSGCGFRTVAVLQHEADRMLTASGGGFYNISASPLPFVLPPEVVSFYDKKIADAVKEQEKREVEVRGLEAQIELLKQTVENERAERKSTIDEFKSTINDLKEERKNTINDFKSTIDDLKEERKRMINDFKGTIDDLKEERKRTIDDLKDWKALAMQRDADLKKRDEEIRRLRFELEKARQQTPERA
ncbi:hypothetical protein BN946_scf184969.g56 [Trametes cinnabarina]|uniref:Uncharacterized protein n=1 Tax=Pycnoporus cinnabarinus TaxID=5643 RepID=A0A060STI1_PYCCI|nr:hypothetical protein BN946_scf184969.g56 [Trametes cinnabarina]